MANGLILLAKDTFSTVSSVSFDNIFSNTYDQYKIVVNAKTSSAGDGMAVRLRVGGSDNSTSSYVRQYLWGTNTSAVGAVASSQNTWRFSGFGTTENVTIFELSNPFQTEYTTAICNTLTAPNGNIELWNWGWGFNGTTSFDGLTFLGESGATLTGSVAIYGLAK